MSDPIPEILAANQATHDAYTHAAKTVQHRAQLITQALKTGTPTAEIAKALNVNRQRVHAMTRQTGESS